MARIQEEYDTANRDLVARLEALIEVGRAVTSALDLDRALSLVVEKSVQVLGVHAAAIHAADPNGSTLHIAKAQGLSAEYVSTLRLPPGEGVSGAVFREGKPEWTQDILSDPRFPLSEARRALVAAEQIRAILGVPLRTPAGLYGVLVLYRRDALPFDPDQVRFATLLADQAAVAIANAHLQEQRFAQMTALSEALRKLTVAQPLDLFYRDLVEVARQAVGARYAALGIVGEDGHLALLTPVGPIRGEVERMGPLPQRLLDHTLLAPNPVRLDDVSGQQESPGLPSPHRPMRSFLGMRIVLQDRLIGALYLSDKEGGGPFTGEDERLVEAFTTNAAVAIANARAYQEVQEARRELEVKTKELEAFTYTVSHDLKAPLRGIDGFSRVLQEDYADRLDAEGRRYLENVRAAARRMDQLIEDLLKYSRLERRAIRRSRVDLMPLCTDALEDRRQEISAKELTVRLELSVAEIEAESEGLREALANLVDNAVKFSKPGGTITISSHAGDRVPSSGADAEAAVATAATPGGSGNTRNVVVAVRDEGIGFDMNYHDQIFKVFQRLHRAEDYEGTGVGLAIVKKVAERHGGHAWATSEPGKGSTFYLAIPT